MDSSWTSTFIPKTSQEQQQEKLVEVLFEFLQQHPKVSDLVMSDDKQLSNNLAQQTDEISPTPIRCTAEAELKKTMPRNSMNCYLSTAVKKQHVSTMCAQINLSSTKRS
jgi:hypothetical protein